jgi:1,4-dihydroxy-6-naphthoate synthase
MRLSISPCPNDTFIFEKMVGEIQAQNGTVDFLDIAELNELAATDSGPDVIKVSCASAPRYLDRYRLLRCGGAFADAVGPLVLKRPDASSEVERVLLPGWRTTAHILWRKWAQENNHNGFPEEFLRFDQIPHRVSQDSSAWGVVIHETRFTFQSFGLEELVDLGKSWDEATRTPVPLGCVLVRRDRGEAFARSVARSIVTGLREAFARPDRVTPFIASHATEMSPDIQLQHIETYVTDRSIDCGQAGLDGLALLWEWAGRIAPWELAPSVLHQALTEAIPGTE